MFKDFNSPSYYPGLEQLIIFFVDTATITYQCSGKNALVTSKSQITETFDNQFKFHHHHISVMELGHLLTRSDPTYPEVSSKVCHDSFCQLGNSVSLPWVIYYGAFYLHVVSCFSCIPVICLKLVLFLIPLYKG